MLNALFVKAGLLAAVAASVVSASDVQAAGSHRSAPRGLARRQAPPLPENDSFYTLTAAEATQCSTAAAGTLLRTRAISSSQYSSTFYGNTFDINQNVAAAYQFAFCSKGVSSAAEIGVATALVPYNALRAPTRILVFQSAENSASKNCAPSFKLRRENAKGDYDFLIEQLFMNRELAQGYVVVYTDHEGPNAAFSAGRVAAHHVLDATRAVLQVGAVVPNSNSVRIVYFGYSGGALATSWAIQEQPVYAPDLTSKIVGASYGGIPVNPKNTFLLLNKATASGVAFAGLAGLGNVFKDFGNYITEHARPNGTEQLAKFRASYCLIDAVNNLGNTDVFTLFDQPQDVLLNAAPIVEQLTAGTLGNANSPSQVAPYPIRIFQAQTDEIVVTADVDSYVKGFCAKNAHVLYVKETLGEHQLLSLTGTPAAFQWVDERFAGKAAGITACQYQTTASTIFSWDAYLVFGQTLINQLLTVYNAPVGPLARAGERKITNGAGAVATTLNAKIVSASAGPTSTTGAAAASATVTASAAVAVKAPTTSAAPAAAPACKKVWWDARTWRC